MLSKGRAAFGMLIRPMCIGWTKYMEWKYPVEVVVTNKGAFKGAGAVGALASL